MFGDEEYIQQDGKYRSYVAGMEKALKNFEYSSEWPDLIAALGKLSKVISSHSGKYKIIPRRLLLSKRLSQCLHPSLPSGVHLKALETYDLVFKSIGKDQLSLELFIYSAGLFPLLNYAGISVRVSLLNIYETHLIPLGEKLGPCLDGFLPAILLGMEETSDFYQRTTGLLNSVKTSVGYGIFFTSIWRCIETVPATRQPAINYMLADKESVLGDDFDQIQCAMRQCLLDNNILVQRASLELLSTRIELGNGLELIKAALKTLLRRDSSLNRRLVTWLSKSENQLVEAIQSLLCENDEDNFRLLVYLFDKSELVSENIIDTILVDIIRSLYIHNGSVLQQRSANLFFTTLHSNLIWDHFYKQLENCIKLEDISKVQKPGAGRASVSELCLLLQFLIQTESTLDKTYLPTLNEKLLQLILSNLSSLNYFNLHSLLQLVSKEGETTLFNDLYLEFVTKIFFVSNGSDVTSVPDQFEKLMKKQIDLYDSGYEFELNLSESMESMSTHEKLAFDPILINSQIDVFDCFKSLNSILVQIDNLQLDTIKALLIGATMLNSEGAQLVCIDAIISILPKIIGYLDLSTTHCVEVISSYLWNAECFDKIFKLYQFFPSCVERVLITQLDYNKIIQMLKYGQDLENSFDSIVLRCLDDLGNSDIVAKAQGESFIYEFYNGIGVILDPVLNICGETLALVSNVVDYNEVEPEPELESTEKCLSAEHSQLDISLSIQGSVEQPKTSPVHEKVEKEFPRTNDAVDGQLSPAAGKKAATIPVYFVEASGKFKKEEIILPLSNETNDTLVIEGRFEDADEPSTSVSLDDMLGSAAGQETNGEIVLQNGTQMGTTIIVTSPNATDDENSTDEEVRQFDNRSQRSSFSDDGSSHQNSASAQISPSIAEPTPEPERRLPPIWKPDLFSIHPYNTHFLLYSKPSDHARCIYALNTLRKILDTNTRSFLISIATTTARSRQTYLELLLSTLIKLCTSFYKENPEYGNVAVHVESMRLLGNILSGLLPIAKGNRGYCSFIGDIFSKLQLQKTILYTLASLVLVKSEIDDLTSTEHILKLNYDSEFDIVYNEVVRLTTCLIAIESETMSHQPKIRSVATIKYIPAVRLSRQPLYLDSLLKSLTNQTLMSCHHATLASITNALPFYGIEEIGRIVQSVITTLCYELVKHDLTNCYLVKILESLTSITHYVLIEQSGTEKETAPQQASSHILYNLVSAFLPMASSWKEKEAVPVPKQESIHSLASLQAKILPLLLPKLLGTLLHLWSRDLKSKILDLINPIAFTHTPVFINALSQQHKEIHICVDLVHRMKVIPLPNLANTVFAAVREMNAQEEENQLTLLTFLTNYIERSSGVSEIWPSVIVLIKESLTLSPRCQVGVYSLFSKMIIDVGVPSVKQEFRDLQDGANKLVESISSQISLEKKHKVSPNNSEILEVFGKSLPKVIDILWSADVLPLLTNIVYYLMPHIKSKSAQYKSAVTLMANLSYYSYLRKAWKKEIFEHLLEPNFFMFPQSCVQPWKVTLDNLFTQDKYTFSEFIARVSVPASLNLFSSKEIEYESRAMLLKRLAFVVYSSPKDQYTKFITNIQERIAEGIKMPQLVPIIQSQVFLCFRVLLLRLSPQHLTSLWPIILHEVLQVLIQMEHDTLTRSPNLLQLYLQVCKLLELSLNLPAGQLPSFQMHRWAFIGPPTETFTPHLTRLALELEPHKSSNGVKALRSNKIECLGELYEFLSTCDQHVDIEILEKVLECDFVEL